MPSGWRAHPGPRGQRNPPDARGRPAIVRPSFALTEPVRLIEPQQRRAAQDQPYQFGLAVGPGFFEDVLEMGPRRIEADPVLSRHPVQTLAFQQAERQSRLGGGEAIEPYQNLIGRVLGGFGIADEDRRHRGVRATAQRRDDHRQGRQRVCPR